MGYEKNLLKKFGLQEDPKLKRNGTKSAQVVNNMANPVYLRQSSALINDALKNGFDVLQLANGDIVTTGTKVIVTKYAWNTAKGKLVKMKPDTASSAGDKARGAKAVPEIRARKKETEDA